MLIWQWRSGVTAADTLLWVVSEIREKWLIWTCRFEALWAGVQGLHLQWVCEVATSRCLQTRMPENLINHFLILNTRSVYILEEYTHPQNYNIYRLCDLMSCSSRSCRRTKGTLGSHLVHLLVLTWLTLATGNRLDLNGILIYWVCKLFLYLLNFEYSLMQPSSIFLFSWVQCFSSFN